METALTNVGVRLLPDVVLSVSGDDVREWLQGQITNDVTHSTPNTSTYTLVTTVKGRILGDAWVLDRGDDGFWLVVPKPAAAGTFSQLDRQIIMEDVTLARTDLVVITAQGPSAEALRNITPEIPEAAFGVDRLGLGGVDFVCDAVARDDLLEALCTRATGLGGGLVSDAEWDAVRIARAVPAFGADFGDHTYPQEAGLRHAVSFTKGCYVGQEVVCRLESRGKVTRQLVSLDLADWAVETAGPIETDGEPVGEITSVAASSEGHVALGYVKRKALEANLPLTVAGAAATVRAIVGDPAT